MSEATNSRAARARAPAATVTTDRMVVQTGKGETIIRRADIEYLEAARNYVTVSTGERDFLVRNTLAKLEQQLAPGQIIRTHRSYLVNIGRGAVVTAGSPDTTGSIRSDVNEIGDVISRPRQIVLIVAGLVALAVATRVARPITALVDDVAAPEHSGLAVGARVEIVSPDRDAPNHLVTLARAAGTNPYEIICGLNPRIRRVYRQATATPEIEVRSATPTPAPARDGAGSPRVAVAVQRCMGST